MFLMGLGALLVIGGILYMAGTAIWRGPLSGRGFLPARSRYFGAATAQLAIPGARNELAGPFSYGTRCSSVGIGGGF